MKQQKEEVLRVTLSSKLVSQAQELIKNNHPILGPVSIPLCGNGMHAVLSPNLSDLLVLQEMKYADTIYYLGFPK